MNDTTDPWLAEYEAHESSVPKRAPGQWPPKAMPKAMPKRAPKEARRIWLPDELPSVEATGPDLLDADIPPMEYVVGELLPRGGTSMIAGAPKAGKTTLAAELAIAGARGEDWLGRRCEPGTVVMLARAARIGLVGAASPGRSSCSRSRNISPGTANVS